MRDMSKLHLGVLGSGAGSNMQSIVDAIAAGQFDAEVSLVLADFPDAKILDRAARHNIPHQYLDCAPFKTKLEGAAEDECIRLLKEAGVDTVVLAGFMRIVKPKLLAAFPNRVLNIHPALLPAFLGVHSWTQALDYGCKVAGVTVHFVDAGTDSGPILVKKPCLFSRMIPPRHCTHESKYRSIWHILRHCALSRTAIIAWKGGAYGFSRENQGGNGRRRGGCRVRLCTLCAKDRHNFRI